MKALTLTQPWATLVAEGVKRIETRSWRTHYRGPLVIHAAKKLPLNWRPFGEEHFLNALEHLTGLNEMGVPDLSKLPTGAALAVTNVLDCVRISSLPFTPVPGYSMSDEELAFGDYTAGRWAWILDEPDPYSFPEPVPCGGRQGLWNPPTEIFLKGS